MELCSKGLRGLGRNRGGEEDIVVIIGVGCTFVEDV
jgi:hypothetical protein